MKYTPAEYGVFVEFCYEGEYGTELVGTMTFDDVHEAYLYLEEISQGAHDGEGFDAEWYVPEDQLPIGYTYQTYFIDRM